MEGKSHTGIVINLGRGSTYAKGSKQQVVAKSSSHAGIIALADMVELDPPLQFEDNKATNFLVTIGSNIAERVRHVHIKNAFVNQFPTDGRDCTFC